MPLRKLMENVKRLQLEKNDILLVKLPIVKTNKEVLFIKNQLEQVIPNELNVKLILSNPNVEFEIIRRKH